ncbi:MAG: hypothetical protein PHY80_04155 [Rickettsiales bacterium]|nr:hypothetical protein [Rickettsiales bacterium]
MANWIKTKNNQTIPLQDIPLMDISDLRKNSLKELHDGKRIVAFFGQKIGQEDNYQVQLFIVLGDDKNQELLVASSIFKKGENSYLSFTKDSTAFHIYEREFFEDFNIMPLEHPWLKPVRFSGNSGEEREKMEYYPFLKMSGHEIHEVGVGPIHAGIIEPNHFRFLCNGEKVYHLEMHLGYQHRGVENLFVQKNTEHFKQHLAESVVGDSTIAYALSYANAMESLNNLSISKKASIIRSIALELERAAVHIGNLGDLAGDVAYLIGQNIYAGLRTLIINTSLEICGSRFGKNLVRVGGVATDITKEKADKIRKNVTKVLNDIAMLTDMMLNSDSVLSRFEKTGSLSAGEAVELGVVGMAARMAGVPIDSRVNYPFSAYTFLPIKKEIKTEIAGNVLARAKLRYSEIIESLQIVLKLTDELFKDSYSKDELLITKETKLAKESFVVSIVEGWRGEVVHTVITDNKGELARYKIKDPSFNNWFALTKVMRNRNISDFPLYNKSFNLSCCGNDL